MYCQYVTMFHGDQYLPSGPTSLSSNLSMYLIFFTLNSCTEKSNFLFTLVLKTRTRLYPINLLILGSLGVEDGVKLLYILIHSYLVEDTVGDGGVKLSEYEPVEDNIYEQIC